MSAGLFLSVLALLASCGARRAERLDPIGAALFATDQLYANRADPEALQASTESYLSLSAQAPDDPRIYWRMARAYTAQAYAFPDSVDPLRFYDLGREFGLRCMEANPAWVSRLELSGGELTRKVANGAVEEDIPCLEHMLTAWVRWVEVRGPSAALDLETIALLNERSIVLRGETADWHPLWVAAMIEALDPVAPDAEEATALFVAAEALEPSLATSRIDWIIWVVARHNPGRVYAEIERLRVEFRPDVSDWGLENTRALQRADEFLSGAGG